MAVNEAQKRSLETNQRPQHQNIESINESNKFRLPFIWREVILCGMITHLPELPWASQLFFYISLQNLFNCLHEEYRLGSARRVTCLAWSLVFEGGVTLQPRISFLPVNALVRLPESTRPCVNSQSKREGRCQ